MVRSLPGHAERTANLAEAQMFQPQEAQRCQEYYWHEMGEYSIGWVDIYPSDADCTVYHREFDVYNTKAQTRAERRSHAGRTHQMRDDQDMSGDAAACMGFRSEAGLKSPTIHCVLLQYLVS